MDDRERQDRDGAISRTARVAEMIAGDFYDDRFDLSARGEAQGGAWSRLPEVLTVKLAQGLDPAAGAAGRTVRLFLTFLAAMDRARDAMRLWMAGGDLFESHPDLFEPARVQDVPVPTLRDLLSRFKVSQRHSIDSRAWSVIARTLASEECPVRTAIEDGVGDAQGLLKDLRTRRAGQSRFPMLQGPKVGPMWVRMMAAPGAANIAGLETLPVAVDTHVKKVTEILGVVDSRRSSVDEARPSIESAWREGVAATKIGGPAGIADTCAALDPALWFFGKHGCSHCQKIGALAPIGRACDHCQLF